MKRIWKGKASVFFGFQYSFKHFELFGPTWFRVQIPTFVHVCFYFASSFFKKNRHQLYRHAEAPTSQRARLKRRERGWKTPRWRGVAKPFAVEFFLFRPSSEIPMFAWSENTTWSSRWTAMTFWLEPETNLGQLADVQGLQWPQENFEITTKRNISGDLSIFPNYTPHPTFSDLEAAKF